MIPWSRSAVTDHWREVSIWAMQTFGLPGDRYVTNFNVLDMTWWFREANDRLLFVLRNGQAQCLDKVG